MVLPVLTWCFRTSGAGEKMFGFVLEIWQNPDVAKTNAASTI